jgi:lipid A 3-O-deacylase
VKSCSLAHWPAKSEGATSQIIIRESSMRLATTKKCAALFLIATTLGITPLQAGPFGGLVEELRLGGLAHDMPAIASQHETGAAINGEVRFVSPDFFSLILSPNPTVGIVIPTTSLATSSAYAGLNWTFERFGSFSIKPFFIDFFFGLSATNGNGNFDYKAYNAANPLTPVVEGNYKKYLGSRILFREALEIGYRFGSQQEHAVSIIFSHLSHGEILSNDSRNGGMDHLGVRYGYKF